MNFHVLSLLRRCWELRLCGRLWRGSCTTSSPLTVPTSTTVTWLCFVTPWRAAVTWWPSHVTASTVKTRGRSWSVPLRRRWEHNQLCHQSKLLYPSWDFITAPLFLPFPPPGGCADGGVIPRWIRPHEGCVWEHHARPARPGWYRMLWPALGCWEV